MEAVKLTRLTTKQVAIAVPVAALLLVAVFVPLPKPLANPTVQALLDFAHFSFAAGACWFLWARLRWPGWLAFATVVLAAALGEVVQSFTGRCPNVADFVRGLLGASVFLICLSASRPSLTTTRWISASIVVAALSAWPISEFLFAAARLCLRFASSI